MSLFNYLDYRKYLKDTLSGKPKQGYGELSKWANSCGVHPTLMSLILKGERDLSADQAYSLGGYLNLTPLELEFFILLVQYARSGTPGFKEHLQKKVNLLKQEATQVKKRFSHESELSDEAKFVFYSSYLYSAIRLSCDTKKEGLTLDELMEKFNLSRTELLPKLEFLEQTSLVKQTKGRYTLGPARTLVSRDSKHVIKHHQNWRLQAMLKAETLNEDELMFTCPMSLSKKDFADFKSELTDLIQKFSLMLKDSKSEDVGCFNIDWFWISSK
ncbi:MAG: TIGR02147 family protein [Bdellovibrionaceae bacterium]|nr:TIGR02147 family protein [Pseudobdellovibrionaceae bacterium]